MDTMELRDLIGDQKERFNFPNSKVDPKFDRSTVD